MLSSTRPIRVPNPYPIRAGPSLGVTHFILAQPLANGNRVTVTYLRSTTRCGLFGWVAATSDLVVVASRRARAGNPHMWRAFSSTAPATRLGHHQQVGHHDPVVDLPGFVRGPASAKAAADDENIRIHEHRFSGCEQTHYFNLSYSSCGDSVGSAAMWSASGSCASSWVFRASGLGTS